MNNTHILRLLSSNLLSQLVPLELHADLHASFCGLDFDLVAVLVIGEEGDVVEEGVVAGVGADFLAGLGRDLLCVVVEGLHVGVVVVLAGIGRDLRRDFGDLERGVIRDGVRVLEAGRDFDLAVLVLIFPLGAVGKLEPENGVVLDSDPVISISGIAVDGGFALIAILDGHLLNARDHLLIEGGLEIGVLDEFCSPDFNREVFNRRKVLVV